MKVTFFNHSKISDILVFADEKCERLPFISTINSIKNIFVKYAIVPLLLLVKLVDKKSIWQNYYVSHILNKDLNRNLWLLIPGFGNFKVYQQDCQKTAKDNDETLFDQTIHSVPQSEKLEIATLLAEKDPDAVLDGLAKFEVSTVQSTEDKKAKMRLATVLKEKDPARFLDKVNEFNFGEMEKIDIAKALPAKNAQALSETFSKLGIDNPEIQWDLLYTNLNAAKARYNLAAAGGEGGLEEKADLDSFLPVALALVTELKALDKGEQIKYLKVIDPAFYYQVLAAYVDQNKIELRKLRLEQAELIALAPYLTYVNLIDATTHNPYTMTEKFIGDFLAAAVNTTRLVLKNSNVTGTCLECIPNKGQLKTLEIQDCPEFNSPIPADIDGLEELSITHCKSYDQPLLAKHDKLQVLRINKNANANTEEFLRFFVEVYQRDRARGLALANSFYDSLQGPVSEQRSLKNILCYMFTQKNPEQAERISAWFSRCPARMLPALENVETPYVHDERLAADPLQSLYILSIYDKARPELRTTAKQLIEFLIQTPMDEDLETVYKSFYTRGPVWHHSFLTALNNSTFFTTLSAEKQRQFFPYLASLNSGWSATVKNLTAICALGKFEEFEEKYASASKKVNLLSKEDLFTGKVKHDLLTLDILYAYHEFNHNDSPPTDFLKVLQKLLRGIPDNLRRDYLPYLVVADSKWDTMLKNLQGLEFTNCFDNFDTYLNRKNVPEDAAMTREQLLDFAKRCLQTPGLFYTQIDENRRDVVPDAASMVDLLLDNMENPSLIRALVANITEIRKVPEHVRPTILPYLTFDVLGVDRIIQNLTNLTKFDYLNEFVSRFPADAAGARLLATANLFSGDQGEDLIAEQVVLAAKKSGIYLERYAIKTLIDEIQYISYQSLPKCLPFLLQRTREWEAMVLNLRLLDDCDLLDTFIYNFGTSVHACPILETSGLFTIDREENEETLGLIHSLRVDATGVRKEIEKDPRSFFSTPRGRLYVILNHQAVFSNTAYINILLEIYPPENPENHSLYPVEVRNKSGDQIYLHIIPQMISIAPDLFMEKLRGCAQFDRLYISSPDNGVEQGGPARQFIAQLFVGLVYNSSNVFFVKGDDLARPRADKLFECTAERKQHYRELGNLMGLARRLDAPKGYPIGELFNQKWLGFIRSFKTEQLEDEAFTAEKFFDVKSMNPQQLIDFLRNNSPIYSSPELQEQLKDIEQILSHGVALNTAVEAARKLNTTVEEKWYYGYEDEEFEELLKSLESVDASKLQESSDNQDAKLKAIHNKLRSMLIEEHKGYIEATHAVAQGLKEALPFFIGNRSKEDWSDIGRLSTKEFALALQGAVDAESIKAKIEYVPEIGGKHVSLRIWVEKWLDDNKNDRIVLGNFVQLFSGARAVYDNLKFSFDATLRDVRVLSCFKTAAMPIGMDEDGLRAKLDMECKNAKFGDVKYGRGA